MRKEHQDDHENLVGVDCCDVASYVDEALEVALLSVITQIGLKLVYFTLYLSVAIKHASSLLIVGASRMLFWFL